MPVTTLEQLIAHNLSLLQKDKTSLDFSHAKISKIGNIPVEISSQVQKLNLSHNNLRSLQGIDQFKKLQILNLANNKISKTQTLLTLKNLLHLKKLSLKGNPFLQNPLSEEILTLLSSYQNDLQILDFAFKDQNRESLIKQHKRSKSQSRILGKSQVQKINSQQDLQNFSKAVQSMKSVQKSKVDMLMSNMQQFIEQKRESQEMSSNQIDNIDVIPVHHENSKDQMSFLRLAHEGFTPIMKKSPKFASFSMDQKSSSSFNQTNKFQEQSTNVKTKNISSSKIVEQSLPLEANTQKKQVENVRVTWQRSIRKGQKKSPQRNFKYQVNNLKINMDLDQAALNFPSIIQKQDQDSYEIEFDFMSPKKQQSPSPRKYQFSPSQQLKQLTRSYVKIQDNVAEASISQDQRDKNPINSQTQQKQKKIKASQGTLAYLTKNMKSDSSKPQRKFNLKISDKQNVYDKKPSVETPINLARKGSLHESTRYVVPQSQTSMAQDIISKLLNHRSLRDNQSFSFNFSVGEVLQNTQKFQRFYHSSLIRLKPTFSLLYSPFNSLKVQQKDLLLQELFKNHKQIFILLMKEFHTKEKLEDEIERKNEQLHRAEQWVTENRLLHEKLSHYEKVLNYEREKSNQFDVQNNKLKRYIDQFEDILASRQKLIADTKREYQKLNKTLAKKQDLLKKSQNQDNLEQKIMEIHERHTKSKFLYSIQKKAQCSLKLKKLITKRQKREQNLRQIQKKETKALIFFNLKQNLEQKRKIQQFINKNNQNLRNSIFIEWKKSFQIDKLSSQIEKMRIFQNKKQFYTLLNKFYLNKKRNRKIVDFNKIRLQKKVFLNCFKFNLNQEKQSKNQKQQNAMNFFKRKTLLKYYQHFLNFCHQQEESRREKSSTIQKFIVLKNQFCLFQKICYHDAKEQECKCLKVQNNVIRFNQAHRFMKNLRNYLRCRIKADKNLQLSNGFRLKKIFNFLKKFKTKNIKVQRKFQQIIRVNVQQKRLQTLIIEFRQNSLRNLMEKKKKSLFFELSKQMIKNNKILERKKQDFLKVLDFRRGLRAKNQLLSLLRHANLSKKMNNKRLVMEQHYLIQESKYKQSYELNMLTMDQMKQEIATYLREIQFYKLQVQKLSQRELFILQEKQNHLLEIQSKQEQNLYLKREILENEEKLAELQRKYQKSLDMYATVMNEINHEKEKKIDRTFYYNTMIPSDLGLQTTFRRQTGDNGFSSLNR